MIWFNFKIKIYKYDSHFIQKNKFWISVCRKTPKKHISIIKLSFISIKLLNNLICSSIATEQAADSSTKTFYCSINLILKHKAQSASDATEESNDL